MLVGLATLNKKFQLAECKSSFADLHEKIK
jgi:hypothetical protein